jgi:hypothetical protein
MSPINSLRRPGIVSHFCTGRAFPVSGSGVHHLGKIGHAPHDETLPNGGRVAASRYAQRKSISPQVYCGRGGEECHAPPERPSSYP